MMRLTADNIGYVHVCEHNGIAYHYSVIFKNGNVSDIRDYTSYRNGMSCDDEYDINLLPATVRKFMETHKRVLCKDNNGWCIYRHYADDPQYKDAWGMK